jgi:hypothetical protein
MRFGQRNEEVQTLAASRAHQRSQNAVRTQRGVAERSGSESSGRHGVDIVPSDTQPNFSNEMNPYLVFDMQ